VRSTSGAYFIALDQVRALAVFLVIAWHFTHGKTGAPVPLDYVPSVFPFALLDEGHTGVALFMTLSGYLFAKLLDGKPVNYELFIRNRLLRLVPLLAVVLVLVGIQRIAGGEQSLAAYAREVALGTLLPTWPNGAWSVTVEFHFYVVLPLLLWMMRRSPLLPLVVLAAAMTLRALLLWTQQGEPQYLAYATIVGRIDQFILGMLAWRARAWFTRRHLLAFTVLAAFVAFYWDFDRAGGFYLYGGSSPLWICFPTIEGAAYAIAIAWYDNSFAHRNTGVSRFIGRIGEYSYSIYLLHFFVVFGASSFVHQHIMDISNFYLACLWALGFLLLMAPVGYLSFRFVESPFLRLRKPYLIAASPVAA
jgi:peptidoglycan/LPS O-acetylase OafA/YrhL